MSFISCLTSEGDPRKWCLIISSTTERCHVTDLEAQPDGGCRVGNLIFDEFEVMSLIGVLGEIVKQPTTTRAQAVIHEREYRGWMSPDSDKDYIPAYGDESKPEETP